MLLPCRSWPSHSLLSLHDCSLDTHDVAWVLWRCLQACSGAGKNEEAVKGMEQLCGVKAQAAGPSVVHSVQAAGVSLEARLQVSHSTSADHHLWLEAENPAAPLPASSQHWLQRCSSEMDSSSTSVAQPG